MLVKTDEFKEIIKSLLPAIKGNQAGVINFQDGNIGSFNTKLAISWPLELNDINCSVPAKDLEKVISGIKEEEVNVSLTQDQLILYSNSTKAKISIISGVDPTNDFFKDFDFENIEWKDLPDDFIFKLNLAKFSTSNNEFDPQNLFCVLIDNDFIYSGNGYRCTKMECQTGFKALIPKSSVDSIVNFSEVNGYAIDDGWIHFTNDNGGVLSSRIVKGSFPNITEILAQFSGGDRIELSKSLIKPLKEIDVLLAKDVDFLKTVKIVISKGRTTITGKKEGLTITKTIDNKYKSDKIEFNISPIFLKDLLELEICKTIRISKNIAIFESDGFSHLVTLPIL